MKILLVGLILINILFASYNYIEFDRLDRYKTLHHMNLSEDSFLQGVYYTDKYYCVWTKLTTNKSEKETEYHEKCHELVNNEYKHFCK